MGTDIGEQIFTSYGYVANFGLSCELQGLVQYQKTLNVPSGCLISCIRSPRNKIDSEIFVGVIATISYSANVGDSTPCR